MATETATCCKDCRRVFYVKMPDGSAPPPMRCDDPKCLCHGLDVLIEEIRGLREDVRTGLAKVASDVRWS